MTQHLNAGMFTSATPEWYTPQPILDRVVQVLGHIDLDPCSNSADPAVAAVPAGRYYTVADNGLVQPWHGRVYMNPPYGRAIAAWVRRLDEQYTHGALDAAIALLPARTDTAWFRSLYRYPCCFLRGRLKFSGSTNSAPFPSVVVYLGDHLARFCAAFGDLGAIVREVRS